MKKAGTCPALDAVVMEAWCLFRSPGASCRLDTRSWVQAAPTPEGPQEAVARYRSLYPNDARMADIASWDSYELQYPDTFSRMFLLWCGRSVIEDDAPGK